MISFVYRYNTENVGDRFSCPARYFKFDEFKRVDIMNVNRDLESSEVIILGGGGVFQAKETVKKILNFYHPKVIGWGIGTNKPDATYKAYECELQKFDELGLRDAGKMPGFDKPEFVPCVSCMHSSLDVEVEPEHDIVAYWHYERPHPETNFPTLKNNCHDMSEAVRHIQSGRFVLTNCYHGWYWATLAKRRPIIYKAWSSKFYYIPWVCPFITELSHLKTVLAHAELVEDALEEARKINIEFYEKIREYE